MIIGGFRESIGSHKCKSKPFLIQQFSQISLYLLLYISSILLLPRPSFSTSMNDASSLSSSTYTSNSSRQIENGHRMTTGEIIIEASQISPKPAARPRTTRDMGTTRHVIMNLQDHQLTNHVKYYSLPRPIQPTNSYHHHRGSFYNSTHHIVHIHDPYYRPSSNNPQNPQTSTLHNNERQVKNRHPSPLGRGHNTLFMSHNMKNQINYRNQWPLLSKDGVLKTPSPRIQPTRSFARAQIYAPDSIESLQLHRPYQPHRLKPPLPPGPKLTQKTVYGQWSYKNPAQSPPIITKTNQHPITAQFPNNIPSRQNKHNIHHYYKLNSDSYQERSNQMFHSINGYYGNGKSMGFSGRSPNFLPVMPPRWRPYYTPQMINKSGPHSIRLELHNYNKGTFQQIYNEHTNSFENNTRHVHPYRNHFIYPQNSFMSSQNNINMPRPFYYQTYQTIPVTPSPYTVPSPQNYLIPMQNEHNMIQIQPWSTQHQTNQPIRGKLWKNNTPVPKLDYRNSWARTYTSNTTPRFLENYFTGKEKLRQRTKNPFQRVPRFHNQIPSPLLPKSEVQNHRQHQRREHRHQINQSPKTHQGGNNLENAQILKQYNFQRPERDNLQSQTHSQRYSHYVMPSTEKPKIMTRRRDSSSQHNNRDISKYGDDNSIPQITKPKHRMYQNGEKVERHDKKRDKQQIRKTIYHNRVLKSQSLKHKMDITVELDDVTKRLKGCNTCSDESNHKDSIFTKNEGHKNIMWKMHQRDLHQQRYNTSLKPKFNTKSEKYIPDKTHSRDLHIQSPMLSEFERTTLLGEYRELLKRNRVVERHKQSLIRRLVYDFGEKQDSVKPHNTDFSTLKTPPTNYETTPKTLFGIMSSSATFHPTSVEHSAFTEAPSTKISFTRRRQRPLLSSSPRPLPTPHKPSSPPPPIKPTTTTTTLPTTIPPPSPLPTQTKQLDQQNVFPEDEDTNDLSRNTFYTEQCGIMGRPFIIGGRRSRPGRWPWQASLQIIASLTPWHRCGGVLVHPKWILTAAHCMEGFFYGNKDNWRIVLDDYNLGVVSGHEIYRSISRIVSHPNYKRASNFPNDVALLEMDSPVDLSAGTMRTACLPPHRDNDGHWDGVEGGSQCWISGWGETRAQGTETSTMNEVPVEVVSLPECKLMWSRVDIDVLDSQVCVGHGETGACYGDSGGPLMCEHEGRFFVTGVMSWLISNCSAPNYPNVFTRLTSYMDWIQAHIGGL